MSKTSCYPQRPLDALPARIKLSIGRASQSNGRYLRTAVIHCVVPAIVAIQDASIAPFHPTLKSPSVIAESPGFAPGRGWQARICRLLPLTFELRFESITQINCREPEDVPSNSNNRRHFRESG